MLSMTDSELLQGLNEAQKKAVTHTRGPLLIVAGAGTGKTTVITKRIAWLIEQGLAKPHEILALTFTEKAAGEMEERVDKLLPYGYTEIAVSTFHAFCERLLRQESTEAGLSRDFRVMTELDAWLLTRRFLDRFPLDYYRPAGNPSRYLRSLLAHFSKCKDMGITPDHYGTVAEEQAVNLDRAQGDEAASSEVKRVLELAESYRVYQTILREQDALDFGDLLLESLLLLKRKPVVRQRLERQYRFILVDEFQDTNAVQYELIKLLMNTERNLTVVGDDDQAIYAFRGASLENILRFSNDFPDAAQIILTDNYRSTQHLLDCAHHFISHNNPARLEAQESMKGLTKKLQASRSDAGHVEHFHAESAEEEASWVAKKILELKETLPDVTWNDFVILSRANDSALPFLSALQAQGIPFQFMALRGLYRKPLILDIVAYLRALDNPQDSPSLWRALRSSPSLSEEALTELSALAKRRGKTLWDAAQRARSEHILDEKSLESLEHFLEQLHIHRQEARKRSVSDLFILIAHEAGTVGRLLKQSEQEKREGFQDLEQFLERLKRFESRGEDHGLHAFLEEFDEERASGEEGSLAFDPEAGPEMVRLMTVHASKGLEFRFVFVVHLIEGRFPSQARGEGIAFPEGLLEKTEGSGEGAETQWHTQEERRLFYVAVTRAKDHVYLTSAKDYGGVRVRKPSRFLEEMGVTLSEQASALPSPFETRPPSGAQEKTARQEPARSISFPPFFSFSQLATFRICPLQYKFAHLLKIPVPGHSFFSFGTTMHDTLQRFFETWRKRATLTQGSLFESTIQNTGNVALPVSLQELLEMYAELWQDEWFGNEREREEYREKGQKQLRAFYATLSDKAPRPLFLEQDFTLPLGGRVLKGRIDRIDETEGGVEIIDYKTGKPKTEETLKTGDKAQLFLYQLAATRILGLTPVKLTYQYLEDQSRVSFLGSVKELEAFEQGLIEELKEMEQSTFPATPELFACRSCDYREICEFRL